MKLLFDENLSAHLPALLSDCFPYSSHVRDLGLKSASDADVWAYAAANGYVIANEGRRFSKPELYVRISTEGHLDSNR